MTRSQLRIGTRVSKLALLQAEEVKVRLQTAWPALLEPDRLVIVPIKTTGEWKPGEREQTFAEMGGNKGWFTKELQEALLNDEIDCAVHSLKDLETLGPPGLTAGAVLPRLDPRDAFLSRKAKSLMELPPGATIGTSSIRRHSQIMAARPDLKVVTLRGNVDTRLAKLTDGQVDATVLALSGLQRLGVVPEVTEVISTDIMLPAAGQGAIAVEMRQGDADVKGILNGINDPLSMVTTMCERAFLRELDGSCTTPIAALATVSDNSDLLLHGLIARPDGKRVLKIADHAMKNDGEALGQRLARQIKTQMGPTFFA